MRLCKLRQPDGTSAVGIYQPDVVRILSSWFLLVIVSFILVADLKYVREMLRAMPAAPPVPEPGPVKG